MELNLKFKTISSFLRRSKNGFRLFYVKHFPLNVNREMDCRTRLHGWVSTPGTPGHLYQRYTVAFVFQLLFLDHDTIGNRNDEGAWPLYCTLYERICISKFHEFFFRLGKGGSVLSIFFCFFLGCFFHGWGHLFCKGGRMFILSLTVLICHLGEGGLRALSYHRSL